MTIKSLTFFATMLLPFVDSIVVNGGIRCMKLGQKGKVVIIIVPS